MALESSDLFIVQRPGDKHYHIKASALQSTLPDGVEEGDYLVWTGATWITSDTVDGGEYA